MPQQGQVFDFAEFLAMQEDHATWCRASAESLAEIYAEDELDYSEDDIKRFAKKE